MPSSLSLPSTASGSTGSVICVGLPSAADDVRPMLAFVQSAAFWQGASCSKLRRCLGGRAARSLSPSRLHEHPPNGKEGRAEHEEADVPADRPSKIVADVVEAEDVVIDDAFNEVKRSPPDQEAADVSAPRWREFTPLPGSRGSDRAGQDCDPSGHMKEPVREGVVLQTTDGVSRTAPLIREQVVPLEDLVKEDAVDESAEADAHEQGREERWTDPVGHWPVLPSAEGAKRKGHGAPGTSASMRSDILRQGLFCMLRSTSVAPCVAPSTQGGPRRGAAVRLIKRWAGVESNHRLTDYESAALTN